MTDACQDFMLFCDHQDVIALWCVKECECEELGGVMIRRFRLLLLYCNCLYMPFKCIYCDEKLFSYLLFIVVVLRISTRLRHSI